MDLGEQIGLPVIFPGLPIFVGQLAEIADAYVTRHDISSCDISMLLWQELTNSYVEDNLQGWWVLAWDDWDGGVWTLLVFSECPVGQDTYLFPFCDLDAPLVGYRPTFM